MRPEWWHGLEGGLLIGLSAALLLLVTGRIAGISGMLSRAVSGSDRKWRLFFLEGLLLAGLGVRLAGGVIAPLTGIGPLFLASGFLVGVGTYLANGCTSGHGVCGLGNMSGRSAVSVALFMGIAALTVFIVRHV